MDELVVVLMTCLTGITIVFAVQYYKQLRKARMEFERARSAVEDIVLSFNRQFKREGERLEVLGYKVEASTSRIDGVLNAAEEARKRVGDLETRILTEEVKDQRVTVRLDEVERKTRDIVASQEALTVKLVGLEQQARQSSVVMESGFEAVIPIRREKAMSQLTDTEISVLELLASEGAKTAPGIKEKVKLSREHTARLMKKLYEEGYLERETGKIPFKYSVKKEMEKLLKKPENQTPQP